MRTQGKSVRRKAKAVTINVWHHIRTYCVAFGIACIVAIVAMSIFGVSPMGQPASAANEPTQIAHYTVQPGDTLWSIANRFTDEPAAQSVERLKALNNLDSSALVAGQQIVIPM